MASPHADVACIPVVGKPIFQRTKSGWNRKRTLVADDAAPGQMYGHALTFRDNTIVVGTSRAAYVFKLAEGTWRQTQKLTVPSTRTGISFPSSLAYQSGLLVAGAHRKAQGVAIGVSCPSFVSMSRRSQATQVYGSHVVPLTSP